MRAVLFITFIVTLPLLFVLPYAAAQTDSEFVISVDSAECVLSAGSSPYYVVSGDIWNVVSAPIYVGEVTGSFYNQYGTLLFTAYTMVGTPLIAPAGSSGFTLSAANQDCSQVASYHLEAT
jgi:hypothetical protein